MDLDIFFVMLFMVEPVFSERTKIRVCLIIAIAIGALENMWTQIVFFCFKAW